MILRSIGLSKEFFGCEPPSKRVRRSQRAKLMHYSSSNPAHFPSHLVHRCGRGLSVSLERENPPMLANRFQCQKWAFKGIIIRVF
jgi:hypothetical protein